MPRQRQENRGGRRIGPASISQKANFEIYGLKTQVGELVALGVYEISEDEAERYIKTGEPMDKAGSYGIQGKAAVFIKEIEGDYYNVVGFPIARFLQEITK